MTAERAAALIGSEVHRMARKVGPCEWREFLELVVAEAQMQLLAKPDGYGKGEPATA